MNQPSTTKQALSNPDWFNAMQTKYNALIGNGSSTLMDLPKGVALVGSKWDLKKKYNVDDTLQRYKTHLVAKGFHQALGLDYKETFSPFVKKTTMDY